MASSHGSPFPLLLRPSLEVERKGVLPRYIRRRRKEHALAEQIVEGALASLNALNDAGGGGELWPEPPRRATTSGEITAAREAVLCNVGRAHALCLPRPAESVAYPEGALCELLRTRDLYEGEAVPTTATFDPDKLRVLKGGIQPKDAKELVGGTAAKFLEEPERYIVLPECDLDPLDVPVRPHWAPELRGNRARKRAFIHQLVGVDLIAWRRRAKCFIGCFFVSKKDGNIRLVLDCRPVNQLHRAPPKSKLASGGALAGLNLSDEWADFCRRMREDWTACGQAGVDMADKLEEALAGEPDFDYSEGELNPCGASVDLLDGFYQFKNIDLASWFCLGESFSALEAGVTQVYDEELREWQDVAPDCQLWACFGGLAMGWSWALYFCHEALSECGRRAQIRCGGPADVVMDWTPAPPISWDIGVVGPYVDNGNVLGGSRRAVDTLLAALKSELALIGLVVHDEMPTERNLELVGRVFRGKERVLSPRPSRTWRLWYALGTVIEREVLSRGHMRQIVGHLVDHLSVRRECLCCLDAVYRFIGDGTGPPLALPSRVLRELVVCKGLLVLVHSSLGRPVLQKVCCSDSSTDGFALHETDASASEVLEAIRWRERWRFREPAPEQTLVASSFRGTLAGTSPVAPLFMQWCSAHRDLDEELDGAPEGPMPVPLSYHRAQVETVGLVPNLSEELCRPERWRRVIVGRWTEPSAIHNKEARAALLGLARESRRVASYGHVLLSLGDNLAEVLASDRGRARDLELLGIIRRACSFQVACDIRWARRYISTDRNISDADSRLSLDELRRVPRRYLPQSLLLDTLGPECFRPEQFALWSGSERALGLAAAVPESWKAKAELEEERSEVVQPTAGQKRGLQRRRKQAETQLARRLLRAQHRRRIIGAPSRARVRAARQSRKPGRKRGVSGCPPGRFYLELFSGVGGFTSAAAELHLRVASPFELENGCHFDLCHPAVEKEIGGWIKSGKVWAVSFGTPCGRWSQANTTGAPDSEHSLASMECALLTVRLLRLCRRHRVAVVVENPRSSRLWHWAPFRQELDRHGVARVDFDMCAFDTAWRKATRLEGNLPGLGRLALRCPGHDRHVVLRGTVAVPGQPHKWRTSFAATYPPRLCRAFAKVLRDAAPSAGHRGVLEGSLDSWWERRVAQVCGLEPPSRRLALGAVGNCCRLGWEGSDRHWCGDAVDVELDILRRIRERNRAERHKATRAAAKET